MSHNCKVKHDVPREEHHHTQEHTTSLPGPASLHQNTESYRWDLLLAADLTVSTGSHAKASPTRQCSCSQNVLVVKHIKHAHTLSLLHSENKGRSILVGTLSERCNLNTGREQSVLFRHTSSFFYSSPAAIITGVYAWAILGSAPHHALQSTPAFQPRAAEIREDAQVWVSEGLTLYWLLCSP